MPLEITSRIDNRYEVLGELGRGGMGVVYKANDLKMDRLVAIKVMTAHAPGRDEYQERFLREARSIAKMQHPNIVVVYDYGYHGGAPYMAMEYVEGVALDRVIASRVNLTPLTKVDYVIQVCNALYYAHQLGIVHRDVKPGNIMVLEGGRRVKLLDFGIARAGAPSNLSRSGLAMGTTCYMSPEQTQGKKDLDARADIFSAGVVLYELLAGKPPWTGESDYEVMTKIIHEPAPRLAGMNNYPAALDRVLELALAKDRNARYETAEKMAQALSELEAPLKERAMEEAIVQFEHGDLLRANDLVSQILRIDTRHREAIELRARLQQVAQLQQRSEQVRQLRTAAEEAVGQKRFSDALAAVEQAINIDSANTELFHYRELIRNEAKRREDIRKKLELAKHAQEMNDLSTAQELVERALEADPTDTQARMMKSGLEQERRQQQLQEIAEEAARALNARAFARANELIQQLESIDAGFARLPSLKKALAEGEAEERRRAELENLVGEVRRIVESGSVQQSLSITQDALVRFPGEPRLVRLRAQAEAIRAAAEREEAVQKQLAVARTLVDRGQSAQALAGAEAVLKQLGSDSRLQSLVTQLRAAVARDQQAQAEQSVLVQARNALQESDFESAIRILSPAQTSFPSSREIAEALQAAQAGLARQADAAERQRRLQAEQAVLAQAQKLVQSGSFKAAVQILTPARLDFPNSKTVADALQSAQAALSRKAEMDAQEARERDIVASMERALATEPDPALQVGLAEEAARRLPGNQAIERTLRQVRERQVRIAAAVECARKSEQAQQYAEAIQQWEAVRKLWPQCPDLNAQIARLKAAQKAPVVPAGPSAQAPRFSATSIMAAAAPAPAPVQHEPAPSQARPAPTLEAQRQPAKKGPVTRQSPWQQITEGAQPLLRSKKLLLAMAAVVVIAIGATVLYRALRGSSTAAPSLPATVNPPVTAPQPVAPAMGTLTIQANVDQVDVFVDGVFKGTSDARDKTIAVPPGNHTIRVEKPGYEQLPAQQIDVAQDHPLSLTFTLNKSLANVAQPPPDTYLMISTRPGAAVKIDGNDAGTAQADGGFSIKVAPGKQHRIEVSLNGYRSANDAIRLKAGERRTITLELKAISKPAPVIASFTPNAQSITPGQSVQLQWKVQNGTVVIDQGIGTVQPDSSTTVKPNETTTYTLTATGEGGTQKASATITVVALAKPVIKNFAATPKKIRLGDAAGLVWSSQNGVEGYISSDNSPEVTKVDLEANSIEVKPTRTTTYTLTIKGTGGTSDTKQAQVTVEAPPQIVQPSVAATTPAAIYAEESDSNAVLATMQRYQDATESMDLSALKKVWPQMPPASEKALRDVTFKTARAIKLHMACKNDSVKVQGDSAEATCSFDPEYLYDNGRQRVGAFKQVFKLQKDKGRWVIVSMK